MSNEKKITYDSKDKIIILKGVEKPSPETMRETINQILELSAIHNCKSALMDVTKTKSMPSTTEMFAFGKSLVDTPGIQDLRFAFVISKDIPDTFEFFDDVVANRGLPLKIFNDLDKAKDWLLNK